MSDLTEHTSSDEDRTKNIKEQIRTLITKLSIEKSTRRQAELRGQIEKLRVKCRDLYIVNTEGIDNTLPLLEEFSFRPFEGNADKMILKDVNNQTVAGTVCLEALVVDCNSINVEGAIIRNSLLLMNVNNSEISANAGQVRLTNCRNVLLKVEAITGIFLQNSKDIRISIGSKGIPKVYDFNSPINSENYVLIPQEPVL